MEQRLTQLEMEVRNLKSNLDRSTSFEQITKTLAMVGAVIVFACGLYQYFDTVEKEFRKTFWQEQYKLYAQVTEAASIIALATKMEDVKEERTKFWSLYWGNLSILENRDVYDAMIKYGENLSELERCPSCANGLKQLSYFLARACRSSLKKTWEPVPLDDIPQKTVWSKDVTSKD